MTLTLPAGLLPRHARFLMLLAARTSLTRADYQRLLAVSQWTAKQDLARLTRAGLLTAHGLSRTRRYTLAQALRNPTGNPPQTTRQSTGSSGGVTVEIAPMILPATLR